MAAYVALFGRCVIGIAGALLIYCSFFLYKEEEGRIENTLEQWWQKIRKLHAHAIQRETAFLKIVAEITAKGFAKLFGERLFGLQAIAASICYSLASFLLSVYLIRIPRVPSDVAYNVVFGFCLFFVVLGSMGAYVTTRIAKLVWLGSVLIAALIWLPLFHVIAFGTLNFPSGQNVEVMAMFVGMLPLGVSSDFLFIALTRYMLNCASQSNSFVKITGLALGNVGLATVLLFLPIGLSPIISDYYSDYLGAILFLTSFSNILDTLVSLAWLLAALVMLLHRLIWPLMERPIYALYRHRVLTDHRKVVFFSGVALLGVAIPAAGKALENIAKVVHG